MPFDRVGSLTIVVRVIRAHLVRVRVRFRVRVRVRALTPSPSPKT